ncbi:hypothetical protein [Kutzneria kofuensis]|uniref:hypothetical protein n=1 Tax=Kutzneria kofuensis TaxID=103725 RepID=UPI0031EF4F71
MLDGRRLLVSGEAFATVVADAGVFERARANRPGGITLMASRTGEMVWPGGGGHDFQRALSERLGSEVAVTAAQEDLAPEIFEQTDGPYGLETIREDEELGSGPDPARWHTFGPRSLDGPNEPGSDRDSHPDDEGDDGSGGLRRDGGPTDTDPLPPPDAGHSPERVAIVPAHGAQLHVPADGAEFALLEHNGRLIDVTVVTRAGEGLDHGPLVELLGARRSAWSDGFAVLRWSTDARSLAGALGVDRAALEDAAGWRTLVVGPLPLPAIDGVHPARPSVLVDGEIAARLVAAAEPFHRLLGDGAPHALTLPGAQVSRQAHHDEAGPSGTAHEHTGTSEIAPADDGAGPGANGTPATTDLLGPGDLAERARRDRPTVEGDIDGAALRDEIARLIGKQASGEDSVLRRQVDSAFSDESLKQYLPQALDGGMVVDFGARGGRRAEVTLEVVSVGKPKPATEHVPGEAAAEKPATSDKKAESTDSKSAKDGEQPETAKFLHEHVQGPVKTNIATARSTVSTDARSIRVPLPWVVIGAKLGGLVNGRESDFTSKTSRDAKIKLEEKDVSVTTAEHDVTYRITVRKRRDWLVWRKVERVGHHDVAVKLSWPKYPEPTRAVLPRMRVEALAHAEFTGVGDLYRKVAAEAGLRQGDPAVHDFRAWLEQLPTRAHELFGGQAVREHFAFNGGKPVEVTVALRARGEEAGSHGKAAPGWSGEVSTLPGGVASRAERASGETISGQSYTRRHGFSLTFAVGLLSKPTGGYAGVFYNRFDNTITGSNIAERHGSELKFSYKDTLERLQTDLTYVVRIGDDTRKASGTDTGIARDHVLNQPDSGAGSKVRPYRPERVKVAHREAEHVITADGAATAWFRPEDKMLKAPDDAAQSPEAPRPADPPGGDRFEVPDRLGARFRLDRATADTIVGPVLNELLAAGAIRAAEVPRLVDRFRMFLDDHAREIVNGDGARFPLSAWRKHAPDVFVRGALDRAAGRHVGEVPSETVEGFVSLSHTHSVEVTREAERGFGVTASAFGGPDTASKAGSHLPKGLGDDAEAAGIIAGAARDGHPDMFSAAGAVAGAADADHKKKPRAVSTGGSLTLSRDNTSRDIDKVGQQVAIERDIADGDKVHRFTYPARFEVRIGGRWSQPDTAGWRHGHEPGRRVVHSPGTVEIDAPLRGGEDVPVDTEPSRADEPVTWHEGPLPADRDHSLGELPAGFEIETLKPVPGLRNAIAELVGVPPKSGWRHVLTIPFSGTLPPQFDEHKGRRRYDRQLGQLDERNVALDALEEFASPVARATRFESAVLFQDTLRLKAHSLPVCSAPVSTRPGWT